MVIIMIKTCMIYVIAMSFKMKFL